MSMSKRDFERLADVLGTAADVREAISLVALVCEESSPDFDRDRFLGRVESVRGRVNGRCRICGHGHDFPHANTCRHAGRFVGDKVR